MTKSTEHDREAAKAPAGTSPPRRKRRLWRIALIVCLLPALLAVAARLALPSYLQSYVNGVLDQSPEYDGRVGTIHVSLWRGAYSIDDLEIVKTTHSVPVPFFEARRVDLSLDWSALFQGQARGKIVMEQPKLNFVHGPSDDQTQTGVDQPWLNIIAELFPFRIDSAEIHEGEIHFHAFHTEPKVDIYLSEVEGQITNLTNVQDKLDPLMATVEASGIAMESGRFEFDMSLDPHSHRPTFNLATQLLDVNVTELNALTRAYGDFDFEAGRFDFVVELSGQEGFVQGYAKPLFRNLKVLSVRDIHDDDPFQVFWEALVGIVGEVFTNQSRDQFGTRITLEGDLDNPRTSILEILGNVIRNAFVRAYLPRIEGRMAPDVTGAQEP